MYRQLFCQLQSFVVKPCSTQCDVQHLRGKKHSYVEFAVLLTGPRKPSEESDQSVLQPTSSSLSLPKGLLQRHALSLGSSLSRGFSRTSPAGGVLDHLQMPNRPGLKFPSRDFARASKTLTSAPLSPKPSLPKPKAPSPSPASPVAAPVRAPSPAVAPEAETLPEAAQEAAAEAEPEVMTKRPVRSRFTEEYLTPVMHSRRAETTRADQAPSTAQQPPPSNVETQTSTVAGQTEADSSVHGFRRHMSLRQPLMDTEEIYAHPRLGRPTADDVIATARPHMAQPQRRATTDFMLEAAEEAALATSATAVDGGNAEEYESDFVGDLVRSLSEGGADDYEDSSEAAVMLNLDAEMAGLLGPEEEEPSEDAMLDMDDEMEGLTSSAAVQGGPDPQLGSDPPGREDPLQSEDSQPAQMAADVHDVLQRVATAVEEEVTSEAAAAVDEAVASLGQEAHSHLCQNQSAAVDSTLESLTTAVATADAADQAEAVDSITADLAARVTDEHDTQAAGEVGSLVISLTHQAEAAEEADQAAAITDVVASLRAQSADHHERSDSLAVSEALAGAQSEAVDHFQAQILAVVDEALGGLMGDTLGASDAEQAAAVGETPPPPFPSPPLPPSQPPPNPSHTHSCPQLLPVLPAPAPAPSPS